MSEPIDRRTLLVRLGSASLLLAATSVLGACDSSSGSPDAATMDHVARVGRAYLDRAPGEANAAKLRRALSLPAKDPTSHLSTLSRAVRADFAQGRVVRVSGWFLSQTEARAAALVALNRK